MEKDSGAADTDLLEGYAAYEEFSRARQITLSSVAIEEAIVSGGVGRVLMALKADDSLIYDGKGIGLVTRALFGEILAKARDISGRSRAGPAPITRLISAGPSSDPVAKRGCRLLAAVHELHKAGYQRIRISVGWSADGSAWRCKLVPAHRTGADGWLPIGEWPEYLSTQGKAYFDWDDCEGDDARTLARKIHDRFPDLLIQSVGMDWAYAGWFTDILGRAEHGELPAFYRGGFPVGDGPESPPLPPAADSFVTSADVGDSWPLISNDELALEHLPSADADEDAVIPFCLSYDGYAGFRTIADCVYIAEKIEREGLRNADLDSLRLVAFIRQRAIKWSSDFESPDPKYLRSIHAVVAEIRRRMERR